MANKHGMTKEEESIIRKTLLRGDTGTLEFKNKKQIQTNTHIVRMYDTVGLRYDATPQDMLSHLSVLQSPAANHLPDETKDKLEHVLQCLYGLLMRTNPHTRHLIQPASPEEAENTPGEMFHRYIQLYHKREWIRVPK